MANQIYHLIHAELFDEALKLLNQKLETNPADYRIRLLIIDVHLRSGEIDKAIQKYDACKGLIPVEKKNLLNIQFVESLYKYDPSAAQGLIHGFKEQADIKSNLYLSLLDYSWSEVELDIPLFLENCQTLSTVERREIFSKLEKHQIPKDKHTNLEALRKLVDISCQIAILINRKARNILIQNHIDEVRLKMEGFSIISFEDARNALNERSELKIQLEKNIVQESVEARASKEKEVPKNLIEILENAESSEEVKESVKSDLKFIKSKKRKGVTKKSLAAVLSIALLSGLGFFGYYLFEKSQHRKKALNASSSRELSYYLKKYGSDTEIEVKREKIDWNLVIQDPTTENINSYIRNNKKNGRLVTIEVSDLDQDIPITLFGVNSNQQEKIISKGKNKWLIPFGARIGVSFQVRDKRKNMEYFTVCEDLDLKFDLTDYKIEVYSQKFSSKSPKGKWYTGTKKSSGFLGDRIAHKAEFLEHCFYLENNENHSLLNTINSVAYLKKSDDFEITASLQTLRNSNRGTYLMFGATTRAFLYFGYNGFSNYGNFCAGINNWDDTNTNWKSWSNWRSAGQGLSNQRATLKVKKEDGQIKYFINDVIVFTKDYDFVYGTSVGFGIEPGSKTELYDLAVYRINKEPLTNFQKDNIYFCSVQELNVRDKGDKGDILKTIKLGEPVKFSGGKSNKKYPGTFNNRKIKDYYYHFELIDGSKGWIHGGGLRKAGNAGETDFEKFRGIYRELI